MEHCQIFLCGPQTQSRTLSSDPKHRMAHAPTADNSSTASLKLTDISTYVSVTIRLEQHVEDFSEESGVLQGTKVCLMEADERRGEDKRQEPRDGVASRKDKSLGWIKRTKMRSQKAECAERNKKYKEEENGENKRRDQCQKRLALSGKESLCLVRTRQTLQPPGTTTSSDTNKDVFNNTGDAEQALQFNPAPCGNKSASVSLA